MRHLLAAAFVLAGAAKASAQPDATEVVSIVEDVCLRPAWPAEVMAVAERRAAISGWRLEEAQSGSRHGLLQRAGEAQTDPPVWAVRTWAFEGVGADVGHLAIWTVVIPQSPAVHLPGSCMVSIPGSIGESVAAQLKSALDLGQPKAIHSGKVDGWTWVLPEGSGEPHDAGRTLIVTEQTITAGNAILPKGGGPALPGPTKIVTVVGVTDAKL